MALFVENFPHLKSNVNVNIGYQSTYPIPIGMRLLSIHVDTHDFFKTCKLLHRPTLICPLQEHLNIYTHT
jgi:hypothetical protein